MNFPNLLTLFRVILIPFFVTSCLIGPPADWVSFAIFTIAVITDILDGYIARRNNLVTDFGKLMDPLADKLIVMTALIFLTAEDVVHPVVTIIVMAREFIVTGLRGVAVNKGKVISANILGKAKTISQDLTVIITLLWQAQGGNAGVLGTVAHLFLWVMIILTIVSAVNYCVKNRDVFYKDK